MTQLSGTAELGRAFHEALESQGIPCAKAAAQILLTGKKS